MKKGLDHIIVVIDKSGSMDVAKNETITGFNKFIEEQKNLKDRNAFITVIQFNTDYNFYCKNIPINEVKDLNESAYRPYGFTAYFDALGKAIDETGIYLDGLTEDEKPENVIMVSITDGQENASKEYNSEKIKNMIKHQQDKYLWKFIFLSAGEEAFKTIKSLNIDPSFTYKFDNGARGINSSYLSMSMGTTCMRTSCYNKKDILDKTGQKESD